MLEPIRRPGKYNYANCLRMSSPLKNYQEWANRVRWYMAGQHHKPDVTVQEVLALNLDLLQSKYIDKQYIEEILAGTRRITLNKLGLVR